MGCCNSSYEQLPGPDPSQPYFVLFFCRSNKIKIVLADTETIDAIRSTCIKTWQRGILQDGQQEDGSYHLAFAGNPFSAFGSLKDAIEIRTVVISILVNLHAIGWNCVLSSDLCQFDDLSTWFFQRCPVNRSSIFCLSLSSTNSLHLIGSDQSMAEVLKNAIGKSYAPGILDVRSHQYGSGCFELKLRGSPWFTFSCPEGVQARKMLLEIIRQFHARRYRLHATVNLKGTADSLFFIQMDGDTMADKFCMVSLNANDRLRLIDCPTEVIEATKQTIIDSWSAGLQSESRLSEKVSTTPSWEFQMRGTPWWAHGADAVRSRVFLTALLANLLQRGWTVVKSLDISRTANDKAVFVLRSCPPTKVPHFCLSLNEMDKIRVIGAPLDIVDVVRRTITDNWIRIDRDCNYHGSAEFQLGGSPWSTCWSNESCLARVLMCRLLAVLAKHGWRVISSADVSAKGAKGGSIDVHSWFLAFDSSPDPPTAEATK